MNEEEMFWDRLLEMPDLEAHQELLMRKDKITLENAMLQTEKNSAENLREEMDIGATMQMNNALLTKIGSHLKIINLRMNRLSWQNAIRAVYGDDGYIKCREWVMTHEDQP